MELVHRPNDSGENGTSPLFIRGLPPDSHGGSSEALQPSSSPQNFFDFSFPTPPATAGETFATDGFFRGRLLPSNLPPLPTLEPQVPSTKMAFGHQRATSLDGHDRRRRREERVAEYQRLRRASSDSNPPAAASLRTWWPFFVMGYVRFPAVMKMGDIRSRQRRRSPSAAAADMADNSGGGRRRRWGILQVLSCTAEESTIVAPPSAAR
ncbi:hypothetical protein AXF42_Ash005767 [Apostasia shenzhenica]|uniref:Uncharacterized protein n=1 Tax=Apostasia shenzhenica TaxID=1088818 RepID=A0A2I0BCB0_9ASPA|nr:hypothetical protein AXF42_Ash005767 [Apostasia shenzhenica]